MNSFLSRLLILCLVVATVSGCTKSGKQTLDTVTQKEAIAKKKNKTNKKIGYNKLLKSNDYKAQFKAAVEYYKLKKNDRVIALMDVAAPYLAMTQQQDTVSFYTAVSYFRRGDFESSVSLLDEFRKQFPRSAFIEEGEYLLALGYYYMSPDPERDQTPTSLALTAFHEFLNRYPNSPKKEESNTYIDELMQKLYDKSYLNALVYYNIGYHKSSVHALKAALKEFPETNHREELLYLITKSAFLYARDSRNDLKHTRYLDMMDAYYNLISEYPETKHLKEVKKMYEQAQTYIKTSKSDSENGNQEKHP